MPLLVAMGEFTNRDFEVNIAAVANTSQKESASFSDKCESKRNVIYKKCGVYNRTLCTLSATKKLHKIIVPFQRICCIRKCVKPCSNCVVRVTLNL